MSVNRVILIGRLGRDPELRNAGQSQVCSFSLATSKQWVGADGERKEKTAWHQVSAWGKLGEVCAKYLRKGAEAYVEGSIEYQEYEDKQGNRRFRTDIVAESVKFLGSKGGEQEADIWE